DELSAKTIKGQKYRLDAFVQWCEEEGIENLNDLTGRDLYEYRIWRREGHGEGRDPIALITLRGQLATVRAFLRFCSEIDAVPEDLFTKVSLPSVSGQAGVSDSTLDPERIGPILDYLKRYKYASRQHVTVLLMWRTGARVGAIRGLDLEDCELNSTTPGVEFRHRPDTDTPLKNKEDGERWNSITGYVAGVLTDYINGPRKSVSDKYGRKPLLTTSQGRPATTTLRTTLYEYTRPCVIGEPCPHNRDPDTCEAMDYNSASKCPSSRSPHDLRSGRVTMYRRSDVPRDVVRDRLNASVDILDRHYDRRSEREKAEQRRGYLPSGE
ncbi:MAG: tyrosine-type recombinase/integrase, partial [Halobacteriota archaeon]